ncbi:MAG: hypothetical protein K6G53_06440 [Bacteroidales bacterium]|nr:hypothetical protein [Bacteroidales bacterium]
MKTNGLLLLSAAIMLASCQSMVVENVITSLPHETKNGEIIFEVPAGQRENVYVVEGNICSVYKRGMNDYVLEIMSMDDTSQVVNLIPFGEGEDAMMLVACYVSDSRILVEDIVQKKYAVVDVMAVQWGARRKIEMASLSLLTQEMVPMDDGKIMYLNPGSFRSREPRFYVVDPKGGSRKLSKNGQKSLNVLKGSLLYNPQKNCVAFLSRHTPEIEFYGADNKSLRRKLTIERDEVVEIAEVFSGVIKEYLFKNKVPICFMTGTSDDERIVAAYRDEHAQMHLLSFDWDGSLEGGFAVNDDVWSVSVCDNYVYCWERGEEHDRLVRYDIRQYE